MIASLHRKNSARAWKFPFLNVLHPGSIDTDRQVMFLLARHGTRMTSDAFTVIDDEAVIHWKSLYTAKDGANFFHNGDTEFTE